MLKSFSSKKQPHVPSDYNFYFCVNVEINNQGEIGKCKIKANQIDLDIFNHILAFSGMFIYIRAYLDVATHIQELFRHIQANSESCVILTYSEPCRI